MWAVEDLMREHGLLNRILIIYEVCIHKIRNNAVDYNIIYKSARIVREFIEEYHEKSEEEFIFPLFKQKKLVRELLKQHKIGRLITSRILELSSLNSNPQELCILLELFCKLYRIHASREDTVLFQELYKILNEEQRQELTKRMQESEENESFDNTLKKVENIEKLLGIHRMQDITDNVINILKSLEIKN